MSREKWEIEKGRRMEATLLVEPGKVEIREVPTPAPGKGEVLIRVRKAGICGTDYALFLGKLPVKLPIIPGHEAVREIAALGPEVEGRGIGERVTIQPNFSCGKCPSYLIGRENICLNKIRLGLDRNGVFSQYVTVPQKYVWPLPEDLSNSEGTLIEPLSVSLHGINKSHPPRTNGFSSMEQAFEDFQSLQRVKTLIHIP